MLNPRKAFMVLPISQEKHAPVSKEISGKYDCYLIGFHKLQEHYIFSIGFFPIRNDSEESSVNSLSLNMSPRAALSEHSVLTTEDLSLHFMIQMSKLETGLFNLKWHRRKISS